ncbi:cytochrome P450 2K1-like isoform X2 [Xiphophorus couchianus]|uniref:cytochrome P450 2K1-like isoform X2 n=1 Tax=Xiphophorus couchianus TaxID=32473 RepID=UPI00101631E9|nr:cytochrome P450 2K1-like isoform X2 [Xiphophorus couchianus]XP_027896307.1 cytochrome P450 2K1-like isoform X2 [Xiphophorus couchianus]
MGAMEVFLQSFSPVSVLGSVILILIGFHFFLSKSRPQGHRQGPPGPKPLPINLLQLDIKRLDQSFLKLSKTYGSVFTVHMGPKKTVVLTGYKTVKEAFVSYAEEFGERVASTVTKEANLHHGIVWANGDSWKEMRRFALTNLKDFGMGKRVCEEKIIEECHVLIQKLKEFKGEAFDLSQHINYAACNVICSMVYGKRFEYDDPEFTTVVNRTNQAIQLLGSPSIQLYNMFPKFGKLVFSARKKMSDIFAANKQHHLMLLNRLKETLSPQMCRGVADAFLIHQQQLKESGITDSHYHNDNLLVTIMNLFSGGTETTSSTLRWAFLFMAKYPKIQDQVRQELRNVIGSRQVQVEDRQNLPFTDAVIHEIQRMANILPLAISHRTSQDITFHGYFIEKGTPVIAVLTSVLQDESEWEKPNVFYPGNFLSKDGKFLKRDAFLPFSTGRRVCLGESLARMELFIFFATLLQHFRFSPPPGVTEEELDLTPQVGGTLSPQPHTLCVIPLN